MFKWACLTLLCLAAVLVFAGESRAQDANYGETRITAPHGGWHHGGRNRGGYGWRGRCRGGW